MSAADYLENHSLTADQLPGRHLDWLKAFRQTALASFSASGFPSPRDEEWRYTNVSPMEKRRFRAASLAVAAEDGVDAAWLDGYRLAEAWSVVLVNGRFRSELSRLGGIDASVRIMGLSQALDACPGRVAELLGSALNRENHGFTEYNGAFFSDGAFIDIPAGLVLKRPIQILHAVTGQDLSATTRSLIALGRHAQGSLVETFVGKEEASYLTAAVTEVALAEDARLDAVKWQSESAKAYHFGGTYVVQADSAYFSHRNIAFGGLLVRNDIHTELRFAAECQLEGLFLAAGRQHVDNHTRIDHVAPCGVSRETYRGILAERSRGVFQGRIVVHPKAQKTQAAMNNRNLLLSDDAEIDTKPQLEILADDVKCSHGVTVGRLNPESIFYLQSRGVDAESARNMLTFAFANEMVDRIDHGGLRALVQEQLLRRFPQSGIRRDWL
jgi:Fe-S cluster assembly protein SufD